jgi:RluA family pseudouridine synthase
MKKRPGITVLFEDESVLAISKPAGLLSLPDRYDAAKPHLKQVLEPLHGPLWIVHRLDLETSGTMVLARNEAAHRSLNDQFAGRTVEKAYHALVQGVPADDRFTVDLPLKTDVGSSHRTVADRAGGKPATTDCAVLERFRGHALVEARPKTGRTHQIRVHLSAAGYPVMADALYGDGRSFWLSAYKKDYKPGKGPERPLLARLGLHAFSLKIVHPFTQEPLALEAPYFKDFRAVLTQLGKK